MYSRQLLNQVCVLYSVTSMMSGQVYSEWRIPSEWEGEDLKVMLHFSGLCVPGPGFLVVSVVGSARVCAWLSRNVWHTTFHFCSFSSPQPLAVALECTTPRTALTKVLVGSLIPRSPTLLLVTCSIEERLGGWGSGNEALLMLCEVCLYKLLKILVSWQC